MKKCIGILAVGLAVCGLAQAEDSHYPAALAARISDLEDSTNLITATLSMSNANNAGSCLISMQADKGDNANDKFGILVADGAGRQAAARRDGVHARNRDLGAGGGGVRWWRRGVQESARAVRGTVRARSGQRP